MCGFAGILSGSLDISDKSIFSNMLSTIAHRGPDGSCIEIFPQMGFGLIFARLSIIDLTNAGQQPMWNTERTIVLVFNGEIYNFQELRKQLTNLGHSFSSRTDTEVILHGYEQWGIDVVSRLDGMFAIAIFDMRPRTCGLPVVLHLVRDRFGKKPLYYWNDTTTNTLIFASEIKAILQHPRVERIINPEALDSYLTLSYIPSPLTMFSGIYKIPAGHRLMLSTSKVPEIKRYWHINRTGTLNLTTSEHKQNVRKLVENAIKQRLVSDVPLGAFLSGGVDSTIVVGTMSRLSDEPVRTFSTAFDVGEHSLRHNVDADMAKLVSRQFGTKHTQLVINPEPHLFDSLHQAIYHGDEPDADPSLIQTYLLAKCVKEHGITVVLSGDGSDELFGGYLHYLYDKQLDRFRRIPNLLKNLVFSTAKSVDLCLGHFIYAQRIKWQYSDRYLENSLTGQNQNEDHSLTKPLHKARIPPFTPESYLTWWTMFDERERRELLSPCWYQEIQSARNAIIKQSANIDFESNQDFLSYLDLTLWMPDENNMRLDKMAMAHAVEVRSPFESYQLAEYATQIPFRQKVGSGDYKKLLKNAFSDLLPDPVLRRPKHGWFSPQYYWINYIFWDEIQSLIHYLAKTGIFRPSIVDMLKPYPTRTPNKLWALAVFALWHKIFME